MCVLVLVTDSEQAAQLMTWGFHVAEVRKTSLQVLCWAYSPTEEFPLLANDESQQQVERISSKVESTLKSLQSDFGTRSHTSDIRPQQSR